MYTNMSEIHNILHIQPLILSLYNNKHYRIVRKSRLMWKTNRNHQVARYSSPVISLVMKIELVMWPYNFMLRYAIICNITPTGELSVVFETNGYHNLNETSYLFNKWYRLWKLDSILGIILILSKHKVWFGGIFDSRC